MQIKKYKIAVLDDYQNVALEYADWSVLQERDYLPFDVVCVMRERTPLPRNVIERLANLKLIASTGPENGSLDMAAADDHEIQVVHTGYRSEPAIKFTWALILASARQIVAESNAIRSSGWQQAVGTDLRGKTLGIDNPEARKKIGWFFDVAEGSSNRPSLARKSFTVSLFVQTDQLIASPSKDLARKTRV
jgi:lactate dehydrogenase-like 2-hydroxyacid dehydrogenase